jgi:hypothetical protein
VTSSDDSPRLGAKLHWLGLLHNMKTAIPTPTPTAF